MDKALPASPFLGRFKRILQSLRPKELWKVAVSRPMAKQWKNCAEESNLRKKGMACKTPYGMLFKHSLYKTACRRCCEGNSGDTEPDGLSDAFQL